MSSLVSLYNVRSQAPDGSKGKRRGGDLRRVQISFGACGTNPNDAPWGSRLAREQRWVLEWREACY